MAFVNSEFVLRYNAMSVISRDRAEAQFADTSDDGSQIALESKETGRVIGMIFTGEDSLRYGVGSTEISYFIREDMARKGYMKEALKALISYLFDTENYTCITARSFLPNIASQRLLESLGFLREGVLRRCVKGYNSIVFDDCIYSLLKEDLL